MFMVILLNALSTLNISAISWRSILLIEETKVPEKNADQSLALSN
jgi:hypothetical protein